MKCVTRSRPKDLITPKLPRPLCFLGVVAASLRLLLSRLSTFIEQSLQTVFWRATGKVTNPLPFHSQPPGLLRPLSPALHTRHSTFPSAHSLFTAPDRPLCPPRRAFRRQRAVWGCAWEQRCASAVLRFQGKLWPRVGVHFNLLPAVSDPMSLFLSSPLLCCEFSSRCRFSPPLQSSEHFMQMKMQKITQLKT